MEVFEIVIALLLGGAFLAALARRLSTPYPALVVEQELDLEELDPEQFLRLNA